ncbi:hypothetical protein GCM10010358_43000 [Streptomyces minutiscleroticus]|uniref:Uncharacterized protein n=1 Tax=Streptomyces minutiscleroticus TaxID=68238 RepID=A0A918U365_9ACTN|nr:hypothetical protein GCM10010358_43000 [Streptomyces minutiscleroticus]
MRKCGDSAPLPPYVVFRPAPLKGRRDHLVHGTTSERAVATTSARRTVTGYPGADVSPRQTAVTTVPVTPGPGPVGLFPGEPAGTGSAQHPPPPPSAICP